MKKGNVALIVLAVFALVVIGLYAGLNMELYSVWGTTADCCMPSSGNTCVIDTRYHISDNEIALRVFAHPECGIPSAQPGDTCSVTYNDVWIYSPSVGGCPQAHSNCNPISISLPGTVGTDYVCHGSASPLVGCGGCTYQRYFNQPGVVSVTYMLPQCTDMPAKPCSDAVWKGYPDCVWDTNACDVLPPPPDDWLSRLGQWFASIVAGIKAWFCTYLGTGCA